MSDDFLHVIVIGYLLFFVGVLVWRVVKAYLMEKSFNIPELGQLEIEQIPSMISLEGDDLAVYERYKHLLSADRFSSKDATNNARDEFLWMMLDLIEPEYWQSFEIVRTEKVL